MQQDCTPIYVSFNGPQCTLCAATIMFPPWSNIIHNATDRYLVEAILDTNHTVIIMPTTQKLYQNTGYLTLLCHVRHLAWHIKYICSVMNKICLNKAHP